MKKFYPCEVSKKLLEEHKDFRGRSNVFELIEDHNSFSAKALIKEEIKSKKRFYKEYCKQKGQEPKDDVLQQIEDLFKVNIIMTSVKLRMKKKITQDMLKSKEEDFSTANRKTADPNNVIDEQLAK